MSRSELEDHQNRLVRRVARMEVEGV